MGAQEFEVVVVGGGAAGCVVAARLSAAVAGAVLLLEAGPDRRPDPPSELLDGWRLGPGYDWGLVSEPKARGDSEEFLTRGASAQWDSLPRAQPRTSAPRGRSRLTKAVLVARSGGRQQSGMLPWTRVPAPGAEVIVRLPATASTRRCIVAGRR